MWYNVFISLKILLIINYYIIIDVLTKILVPGDNSLDEL